MIAATLIGALMATIIICLWLYFKVRNVSAYSFRAYIIECLLMFVFVLIGFSVTQLFTWISKELLCLI